MYLGTYINAYWNKFLKYFWYISNKYIKKKKLQLIYTYHVQADSKNVMDFFNTNLNPL